ncbi:MraY family glycosyltransferase [Aquirufa sp.]|jgi:UDP-GlcNAc:undecaprenyl-phosphate GlcNAc-1-phosphate transferase|uniref:MraY family glycosyltransferase n=1 Tax=Aquirufa sp. TaxID=2676249 RepID=UPI0037C0B879
MDYIKILDDKDFQLLISFVVSLFITITAIPVIINISRLKDLMAEIKSRSSHKKLTPTLGGVAIFAATLITYFIWDNPKEGHDLHLTISAIIILFFLGIKDDILILSPKKKLLIQIAASLLVISLGNLQVSNLYGLLGLTQLSYNVGLLTTIFIFISLINAINLIDGIDGLAGSVGLFASLMFSYLFYKLGMYAQATLAVSLSGSLLGFLRYNWSTKNKIFMGDTGSLIVGFLLSYFAIKYVVINNNFQVNPMLSKDAPLFALSILILPVFDTIRMFFIRLIEGKSPFEGDRKHLHHVLIDIGFSHKIATALLLFFNIIIVSVFTYLSNYRKESNNKLLLYLAIVFAIYCTISYLLSKKIDKALVDRVKFREVNKVERLRINEQPEASEN